MWWNNTLIRYKKIPWGHQLKDGNFAATFVEKGKMPFVSTPELKGEYPYWRVSYVLYDEYTRDSSKRMVWYVTGNELILSGEAVRTKLPFDGARVWLVGYEDTYQRYC